MRSIAIDTEVTPTTEFGDADHPWPIGDLDAMRRRARQRRLAWARQVPASVSRAEPDDQPGAPPLGPWDEPATTVPRRVEARTRAWSLNVEVIDRERLVRGWTQRELARHARVDKGTLGDMLARRRRPTLGTVRAICAALDLSLDRVLAFE
jgi:DNA-binding XRE family transcriptional regulator